MVRAVFDIETVSLTATQSSTEPNTQELDDDKAALDPLRGRVACIGLILLKDRYTAELSLSLISKDEGALLQRFWNFIREKKIASFVTHNGLSFDLPYLWKRSVVNQVRPTLALDLRRYRTEFVYDTMAIWANWEPRSCPKLESLAEGLKVGKKSGAGSEVAGLWLAESYAALSGYCLHDCWLTYACYCKMEFAELVPEDKISTTTEIF